MFDFVRDHKRWMQFLLLLLIFPSFVFFGIQGYSKFTDTSNATVAEVGGGEIKLSELEAAQRRQIERMREQMPNLDSKLFDTPQMRAQTLDGMVREQVMSLAAIKDHLVVSDERLADELMRMPELAQARGADGRLDMAKYAALLGNAGHTPASFEAAVRRGLQQQQVMDGASRGQITGAAVTGLALDAMLQRREIQLQLFKTADLIAKIQPTDEQLQAFYKAHSGEFRTTEEAQIEYVVFDLEALKKRLTVADADIQKYYDEHKKTDYTTPEERRASHILIQVAPDAKPEEKTAARAKIDGLLAQAKAAPGSFAELAKKHSDDKSNSDKGGDLDYFDRNAMVKPFADAAYGMKIDEISPVVETEFGFHIIRLTGIRGGQVKPLEAVKAQIADELASKKAKEEHAKLAVDFSNMVDDQSDSLQPVLEKFKLDKQIAVVRRQPAPGAQGALGSQKLLDAVFAADVLKDKRNTRAIDVTPTQLVAARLLEHRPERVRPLEEVKAEVTQRVRQEQAQALARKDGEARLAALKAKPDEALPQALTISRTQSQNQSRQVVEAALKADLAKGPAILGVDLGEQGYAVLKVLKLLPREAADADNDRAKPYVQQALTRAEEAAFYEVLKRRMKVKLHAIPAAAGAASAVAGA